jgi:Uncharacterised nucleotidyltransferase
MPYAAMTETCPKRAVLAALSREPDFSQLGALPQPESKAGGKLLQWLDRSGLALVFLNQLQREGAYFRIPAPLRFALWRRQARNVKRTMDILGEARRLCEAFAAHGLTVVALKGFTLAPDFCDDPHLQVDFDFLVAPGGVPAAAEALRARGYSTANLNVAGETCFRTPLRHIPSSKDDLYGLQKQRQVDLHTKLLEPCPWLPIEAPQDCLQYARWRKSSGFDYLGLSLEDAFLFQVLHTFRHSFRSWVRLSWLFEIAKCLANHQGDEDLWSRVIHRAGSTRLTKSVFAFVLGLVTRLFHSEIPSSLRRWTAEAMTLSLRTWLDHFGVDWAIADWPGSLSNLFLTSEFIPDRGLRMKYWRSRLLPQKVQTYLGNTPAGGAHKFLAWQAARIRYVAERGAPYVKDLMVLPWQRLRWRRAIETSRRLTLGATC